MSEVEPVVVSRVAQQEARIKHFGDAQREEVLVRSGDAPDEHARARDAVVAAMIEEGKQGEHAIAAAFARQFAAEKKRLQDDEVPLSALGDLPVAPEPPVAAVELPASPAPPEAARAPTASLVEAATPPAREVPTYLHDAPMPAGSREPDPPLPHAPPMTPVPQQALPIAINMAAHDPDATMLPFARFESVLPFQEDSGASGAGIPPAGHADRGAHSQKSPHDVSDDPEGTRMSSALGGADETAYLAPGGLGGPATPFDRDAAGALTLAAYARFLGSFSAEPEKALELRAKHGIANEAEQRALGVRFAAEFDRDPTLRMRFEILVAQARTRAKRDL